MITVKGEYYTNDFRRRNFTERFADFDGMLEFFKRHLNGKLDICWGGYDSGKRMRCINLGYRTDLYEDRSKNKVFDTFHIGRLEADPGRGGENIWVYYIESERGIEFSTGMYTSGIEHASKAYKDWALASTKALYELPFNFVD